MKFRWIAGSLLLAASLFLGADEARAQVCGALDIADDVSQAIYGYADDFQIPDAATCAQIAKAGAKACHRTVAQVASCSINRSAGVFRTGNLACRSAGDAAACSAQHRALLEQVVSATEVVADQQHALCDDLAEDFFGDCLAVL
jgi:hypothetical protein